MKPDFKTISLLELRALVNAGVAEMKGEFDGYHDEIDDWASGGWSGMNKLKRDYANAFDHAEYKINALRAFDTLMQTLRDREEQELKKALDRRLAAA